MRNIVEGVLATLVVFFVIGLIVVGTGAIPSGADAKPSIVEQLAAKVSLNVSLRRESSGLADPLPLTEQNLDRGVKLYAANCAVCHGAADARASTLSKGFYIEAPQLAKDGVEDDAEAVTFLKLKHGIRSRRCRRLAASCPTKISGGSRRSSNTWINFRSRSTHIGKKSRVRLLPTFRWPRRVLRCRIFRCVAGDFPQADLVAARYETRPL